MQCEPESIFIKSFADAQSVDSDFADAEIRVNWLRKISLNTCGLGVPTLKGFIYTHYIK